MDDDEWNEEKRRKCGGVAQPIKRGICIYLLPLLLLLSSRWCALEVRGASALIGGVVGKVALIAELASVNAGGGSAIAPSHSKNY